MNTTDQPPTEGPENQAWPSWPLLLKKLTIWALFFLVLYLARDFFFTAFMTFLFCYLALAVVGKTLKRMSPHQDRPGLRLLLTVSVFLLVPLVLFATGALLAPRLLAQAHRLGGWLNHVTPESEAARLLENFIGPYELEREYGGPDDPRYQKALAEFRKTGERHVAAYLDFAQLESWVEGGFSKQFAADEQARARARLLREGTSSKDFAEWFAKEKYPELQEQARKLVPAKGRPTVPVTPLVRAAASTSAEHLLEQVRGDPVTLVSLREEWVQDTVDREQGALEEPPAYREELRAHYESQRARSPSAMPYTFEEYLELQKARLKGRRAFGDAVEKMRPAAAEEVEARARADFEAAKKHELFQAWWGSSPTARFIRQHAESTVSGGGAGRMERIITSLINVPLDIGTALLLSFFICIDFPNLKRAIQRLETTWLRDVYREMAPALTHLAQLIGRSMHAQSLIALCNAVMIFFALTLLGVEHEIFLSVAVFVLCLVPTLGAVIGLVLIAAFALLQFGGGPALALKAAGAMVCVLLVENFILSPRILGRMMELHPVLVIAILPVAQYFFGVWGLILAVPVAVYIIQALILRRGLEESNPAEAPAPSGPVVKPAPPAEAPARALAQDQHDQVVSPSAK